MTPSLPQNLSTLILPGTIPQEDSLRQLLLYFEEIFLYSPAEDSGNLLPEEFSPLCCHYAPVPFGDGLQNFQQLIRDMTHNRGEYYGGGLSSMSAKTSTVDDESVWRLISRLTPQAAGSAHRETLLQARLLLKLAEIRDLEENEIELSLAEIEDKGQAMLHGLAEEDDDEGIELPALAYHGRQPTADTLEKRLRAWAHLFLADERRADHWLVSTTLEVLDILAEHSSLKMNEGLPRLCSLPLPGSSIMKLSPADYLKERDAWRLDMTDCLGTVASSLKTAAASGPPVPADSIQNGVIACLEKGQAWQVGGADTLDFYLLPMSLTRLFAKIAKTTEPPPGGQTYPFGVVAVISRAEAVTGKG